MATKPHMHRLVLFVLHTCLTVTISGQSDARAIRFDYLTVDDGLSQGIVQDVFQDSRGFIWLATRDGLNRFDGLTIAVFRHERTDPNSLASNFVYCMEEDSSGNLWVGSKGLNRYEPATGKMIRIRPEPGKANAFQGGWVYQIATDLDGTLWMATSKGLVQYSPGSEIFKTYGQSNGSGALPAETVYGLAISRDGRLWVAPDADPVYEFNRSNRAFVPVPYKIAFPGQNVLKKIQETPDGRLFIYSENAAIHIYDPKTGQSELIDQFTGLRSSSVKSVLFNSETEYWIGTDGAGICLYNPVTRTVEHIQSDTRQDRSLAGNAVYDILKDRDNNVWIGHFGTGVSIWKRNQEKFLSFHHNPLNPKSLNREIVSAVFEDSKGRIWVGQDGGGLNLFHPESGAFDHFTRQTGDPYSLSSNVILSIAETKNGKLLLGTYAGGLMVFDPESGKVIRVYTEADGLPSDHIWKIYVDSRERIWLLTLRGGVSLFHPELESFRNFSPGNTGSPMCALDMITMAEDPEGNLWFATDDNGICVLNGETLASVKSFQHDEANLNTLSENSVRSIVFDEQYAWVATNGGGLNRIHMKTDSVKVYSMADGLSSNVLMGILPHGNNLWISSTRGLMKFDPDNGQVVQFDRSHGIQGNEFKYNAQCSFKDGRMAFGGVNGLTLFHPDSIRPSCVIPRVVFTDFRIYNQSVVPGAKGSPLLQAIDFTGSVEISYKKRVITFCFASLDYNSPESNRFRYRLEGFDEDWVDAGNQGLVTYTNLSPGHYTFYLKGSNSDGVWNEEPRSLSVRIRPPWYRTRFAILSFVVILAVTGRIVYRQQRLKRSVKDNEILQKKIDEAQGKLEAKIAEVEMQREELRQHEIHEKNTRFFTDGLARFNEIMAMGKGQIDELANALIRELTGYLGASSGIIFLLNDNTPGHSFLYIAGSHQIAFSDRKTDRILPGEGYVGACFISRETIRMNNLPHGYRLMRSGLGEISLKSDILVPLVNDGTAIGVIELASVEEFPETHVAFAEKIAESFASMLALNKANERNRQILEESSKQIKDCLQREELLRNERDELHRRLSGQNPGVVMG